jgi:hypothetical protein
MGVIEGFAEYALDSENIDSVVEYKSFQMKLFFLIVFLRLLMIFIVSSFLWPKFVPKVFTGVKSNPGFMNILGIVIIYNLLF